MNLSISYIDGVHNEHGSSLSQSTYKRNEPSSSGCMLYVQKQMNNLSFVIRQLKLCLSVFSFCTLYLSIKDRVNICDQSLY